MFPFRLFDPYDQAILDARERQRRDRLGTVGRLKEDIATATKVGAAISLGSALTVVPWAVGIWTIGRWFFG